MKKKLDTEQNVATTPKEALVAGRWILDRLNWIKGDYFQFLDGELSCVVSADTAEVSGCCAVGALKLVQYPLAKRQKLLIKAQSLLVKAIGSCISVQSWNDDWADSKAEVLAIFDKAIALSEEQ